VGGLKVAESGEYKNCPHCGAEIKAGALKCRHCKRFVDTGAEAKGPVRESATCPECGNYIFVGAKKCKHCKTSIEAEDRQKAEIPQAAVQSFYMRAKENLLTLYDGLMSRLGRTAIGGHKKIIAISALSFLAVIIIALVSVLLVGQFGNQVIDNGMAADKFSESGIIDEFNENGSGPQSPIVIIYANRVREFEGTKPSNPGEEVILVVKFYGIPDARLTNSHLLFDETRQTFFSGFRVTRDDTVTSTFAAIVPRDILEFELHVGDHPPALFYAVEEIYE
jgi:hypothetical protein